jgi:hypothetical protein
LAPFIGASALLAAWIVYWSFHRRSILAQRRSMPQPASLDLETQASQFGLRVDDVTSFRESHVVTVRFDTGGAITPSPR